MGVLHMHMHAACVLARCRRQTFKEEAQKAMGAGWHEKTEWKEGLAKTVEWYRIHGLSGYWDDDAVEKSLDAHPTFFASQSALDMPAHGLPKPGLS